MRASEERVSVPAVHAHTQRVQRNGQSFFEVTAKAFVRAQPPQIWGVLTDYSRLAEFVPDLHASRLISRNGHEAIIEQRAETGFLFISQSIRMVLRMMESPISAIDSELIDGDLRYYKAHWDLMPAEINGLRGTHVAYSGAIEPDFFVPALLGRSVVQANAQKMLVAVLQEIERRAN